MRRRVWMGMIAGAALSACAGTAAKSRWSVHGRAGAPAATAPATPLILVKAPPAAAAPVMAEPPTRPLPETGVALALRYRDDICACATRACWHEASAAFRGSVGLAVPRTREDAQSIDAAFREASACIERIHAAELTSAALEATP